MRYTYDPEADAAYLRLSDALVADSEMVKPGVVLDFDDRGRVVGIELLDLQHTLPEANPATLEVDAT